MKEVKFICYVSMLAMFIAASCRNQEKEILTEVSSQAQEVQEFKQVQEAQKHTITEGFTTEEFEIMHIIKADFDNILNIGNSTNRALPGQYGIHLAGLSDAFFQKNPIYSHPPYDNSLRLAKYDSLLLDSNLWSFKCGFGSEDGQQMILNYYCLNTYGPIFNYLQNITPKNELIQLFVSSYLGAGDFTAGLQQSMSFDASKYMDFNNPDHQMFWMIYHLSLNEALNASKTMNSIKAQAAAKARAQKASEEGAKGEGK